MATPKNFTNGTLELEDGTTPAAVTLEVPFDMGDTALDSVSAVLNAVTAYQRRGSLIGLAHGERVFPSFGFSATQTTASSGVAPDIAEAFILKIGGYATNVSTQGTGSCQVYTINVTLTIDGACLGEPNDIVIKVHDWRPVVNLAEGDPNTVSFSGDVYGKVTWDGHDIEEFSG
jgi:hypothetical protein